MTLFVFLVVLGAALLHAAWNAAVKGSSDKTLGMAAVMTGHIPPALFCLCFFAPPSAESIPLLIMGVVFHTGYQLFLVAAYKVGDFTQVYPIARGTGPLIVTIVSIIFLSEQISSIELISISFIIVGIISLSIVRQGDGLRNPKAAILAICTGCCIAGYSLSDGLGARLSESAIGYMSMLLLIDSVVFLGIIRIIAPGKITLMAKEGKFRLFGGGLASFVAYLLVVWAFTQAPIALVTALRETSIVFAVLIGVFIFREKLNLAKVISTFLTIAGAVLLRFGKYLT